MIDIAFTERHYISWTKFNHKIGLGSLNIIKYTIQVILNKKLQAYPLLIIIFLLISHTYSYSYVDMMWKGQDVNATLLESNFDIRETFLLIYQSYSQKTHL